MLSTVSLPVCIGLVGLLGLGCSPSPPPGEVLVGDGFIEFSAVVSADSFQATDPAGYHLIVWEGGRAVHGSLFRSRVTDLQVIDALESLGARPGDALGIDTWDERHDEDSEAPDRVIEGPRVRLTVHTSAAAEPLQLSDVLEDPGARGFDLRFGGHRANVPKWHSGCVVCLYSCPGSKVGNARYTVRDFVLEATHFRARAGALPADGTEVRIRLRLLPGAEATA